MTPLKKMLITAALLVLPARAVRADTLWIGEGAVNRAIKADNVKISAIKDGKLFYTTDGGMQTSKLLAQLAQINLDGETVFNTAENAYGSNDMDTAITNYQLVLQNPATKDWMQSRAATRLIAAAKIRNRYDAEVSAYCSLLLKDPAAAAGNKPGSPPEHSQYLDTALASVQKTLDSASTPAQKSALLNLELDIDRAKGDKTATNATLQQLIAMGGATPADQAMLKLAQANVDLDGKQYDKAIADIDKNRAMFTEPDQQVDALYVLAQAHLALEGDKADNDKLKDLALNYMRVVTFGSKLADRPHVADSMLEVAQIEDKLGEKPAALQLQKQLMKDFPGTPAAAKAQAALGQASKEGPALK